ncbi:MAG: hypothetical protein ACT6RD_07295 [Brevundimonas sp.]|uniref:hypothetical protein n=1 Tax=Brevundimonas sp. TaxID=1871086 RepID=UPI00403479CC
MKRARPWLIWLGIIVAASTAYNWHESRGGLWMARTYATSELVNPALVGTFESLQLCLTAAEADLRRRGLAAVGHYSCGRKCEWRRHGYYACAEERTSPPRREPIRPAPADAD